jgi:hypothetical protein
MQVPIYGLRIFVYFPLTDIQYSSIMVSMNYLNNEQKKRVVAALVEGNSIRATVRMTGVARTPSLSCLPISVWLAPIIRTRVSET